MADITLFPNGDRAISGWQDEGDGTTDIFNSIDEGTTSPNDSDYVHDNDSDDTAQFDLDASPGNTSEVTSVDLSVRAMKESGGKDRLLEAKIWINSIEVANLTWTVVEYDGTWLTKSTGAQAGSWTKAQIDAAYIEFISTSSGGGGPREVRVSAAQLAIVYTEGGQTFFQDADATAIGVGVEAETSERFRTHSATAIGIAVVATIATFLRTFAATAIGVGVMTKKMFEAFPATAVGVGVVVTAKMFVRAADAVAIGIAAVGVVPTFVRLFAATAIGVATESHLTTFFRTIPATAVGVAEATKKMFETFPATAIGVGGLTTAKFFVKTADAVALGVGAMTRISTRLRTFAATAIGVGTAGVIPTYVRTFAATATGIPAMTKKMFETVIATAIGVAGAVAVATKTFFQSADAIAVGVGDAVLITTFVRTLDAIATGVGAVSTISTRLRSFAATALGNAEMTKKMFITLAGTAIGLAALTTAKIFTKAVDAVAIGVAGVNTVRTIVRVFAATALGVVTRTLVTTILGATSTIEYRKTTIEYLREFIGDQGKLIYTDQELDAILRGHVFPSRVNERLNAILTRYYSLLPSPVLDLTIIDPVVGNHYRIDESTKYVQFVSGTPPTETTSIEVQYVRVNFFAAVADILVEIAIDKAKLAVIARTGNVSIDMTQLSRKLMLQAQRISVLNYWEFGAGYG